MKLNNNILLVNFLGMIIFPSIAFGDFYIDETNKTSDFNQIEFLPFSLEERNKQNINNIPFVKKEKKSVIHIIPDKEEKSTTIPTPIIKAKAGIELNNINQKQDIKKGKEEVKNITDFNQLKVLKPINLEQDKTSVNQNNGSTNLKEKEEVVKKINEDVVNKPKILLKPIDPDFSSYGVSNEEKTKLVSIQEYQKTYEKENQQILEKRKKDFQERNKTYEETIDNFFK